MADVIAMVLLAAIAVWMTLVIASVSKGMPR